MLCIGEPHMARRLTDDVFYVFPPLVCFVYQVEIDNKMNNKNRGRNNFTKHGKSREHDVNQLDEDNPIVKAFRQYSNELDDKHDRQERLIKLSRDITIESKRIIFLLHNIDGRKNNKAKVLEEAEQRLNKVISVNFKGVAKELQGQDVYQYRNAYSPGLQEFIEAYSFMEFFRNTNEGVDFTEKKLSDWIALQSKMQYEEKIQDNTNEKADLVEEELGKEIKYEFHVDPTEYILGLSDLTGELMRRCINSLGSGETDACLETCRALQLFYTGYISLSLHRGREISRKIFTMRQSVLKAENVCYNVKVRGGEAAKWGSVFDNKPVDDVDEGFY